MQNTCPDTVPRRLAETLSGIDGTWITAAGPAKAPRHKGAYLLLLRLAVAAQIDLRGTAHALPPGWYVYAGSARGGGGIGARTARHLRKQKTIRWHIDQLTTRAVEMSALAVPDGKECALVAHLLKTGHFAMPVRGFGSSDCRQCTAHLLAAVDPDPDLLYSPRA
ncbi:DUF123 domain-containing protein [Hoeflea poritis]|uniref:DUF123 domain-containing protein n=1 Tax=Hoeflea poritis TaxID=2993659 RepID=A0ABT4VT81_9HYPH|nr:DUF123 domain-containing protein [Hoeflea poritis]MDA4847922.1 DUF123 domain-containing protein [Hoeflea poritis]